MSLATVINAEYKQDFQVYLKFSDGVSGIVNLDRYLEGEVFEPLKNPEYFRRFALDSWTITWENGADFSPEFLYELIKNK